VRRALLAFGALAAAAVGVLLLLFAVDVHRWQARLATGDAAYRTAPGRPRLWQPSTVLPASLSRGALGLADDLAYRDAMRLFERSDAEKLFGLVNQDELNYRAEATVAFSRLAASDSDRARRSQELTSLGVLDLLIPTDAKPAARLAAQIRAAQEFTEATRADPANTDAKYDLELALRLIRYQSGHGGVTAGTGGVVARGAAGGNGY
jgi:hypothetical protein